MKKYLTPILVFVLCFSSFFIVGCEKTEDNYIDIINNGRYQQITVQLNGELIQQDNKAVWGPSESIAVELWGDDGDQNAILVRIYDLSGRYITVESRKYYYHKDRAVRDTWIIQDRYGSYW